MDEVEKRGGQLGGGHVIVFELKVIIYLFIDLCVCAYVFCLFVYTDRQTDRQTDSSTSGWFL